MKDCKNISMKRLAVTLTSVSQYEILFLMLMFALIPLKNNSESKQTKSFIKNS
jgi:hypothetical protein